MPELGDAAAKLTTEIVETITDEAKKQGMNKKEWFAKSDVRLARFTEFAVASGLKSGRRSRDVSSYYLIKLARGLGLNVYDVETNSKIKFTTKQQEELELTMKQHSVWTFSQDAIEKYPFLGSLVEAANDGDEEFLKATIKHAYKKYIKEKG